MIYHFDNFEFDSEGLLLREGQRVEVPPKALTVLALLATRAGNLVKKEAIMDACWPSVNVTDANLTQAIFALRTALGQKGRRGFIETVDRRGYRFYAPDLRRTVADSIGKLNEPQPSITSGNSGSFST